MINFFSKEELNINRQYNLDYLKALAIISMILCHAVMQFGAHTENFANDFAYRFGAHILGTYIAVAHAFMFCMGVGMVYSRKTHPKYLLIRGIKLFLLGYVLNFFRYSIYIIVAGALTDEFRNVFWHTLYIQDILHFAGIAMMLTAFFKKLKLNNLGILIIAVIMSIIGSIVAFSSTGILIADIVLGSFFTTTTTTSCFTLFNWYIFVALGMVFGNIIRRIQNLNKFYKYTMLISGVVMITYIVLTSIWGFYFLTKERFYFAVSTAEALGFLSIDIFIASLFYFISNATKKKPLAIFVAMSKNVNTIYIIHWCIIGFIDCIFCYFHGFVFPHWFSYIIGIVITLISYILAEFWKKHQCI